MAKALYICYFGVREPLVQTQVIPYLRELVKGGNEVSLLTFEPVREGEKGNKGDGEIRSDLEVDGIEWHWLRYHKRPSVPATVFDIVNGARFVAKLMRSERFDILHARSHVPMVMAALARKMSGHKPKLLFDIRGFFPEEYVDAGIWPENGSIYRGVKRVERWLMSEADGFVVLTEKARGILFSKDEGETTPASQNLGHPSFERRGAQESPQFAVRSPHLVEVIPCCVDLKRFETANEASRREVRERLGIGERFVGVYVGSFGGWYLTEETADFFAALKKRKPDAFALVLTQSKPEMIEPLLKARGYGEGDYFIQKVPSAEIPAYLSAADLAVSFIKPCYSKLASSPTKNAEYLACGLPIVVNDKVGDTTEFTVEDKTGVVISEFTPAAYTKALEEIDELMKDVELTTRCRESARKRFDLGTVGGLRYKRLYESLQKIDE